MKVRPKDKHIKITGLLLEYKGTACLARRATRSEIKKARGAEGCTCGEELCIDGWVWRCMYAGAGVCDWFITNIVCERSSHLASRTRVLAGKKAAFVCGACGRVQGYCAGGVPGQRCVYCSSPGGHCRCRFCGKEHYEISHVHR